MTSPFPATLLAALLLTGCAVPKDAGFADVAKLADERSGHRVEWSRDAAAEASIRARVRELVAAPLTPALAVEVALLGNPALQATYEELMIAQADLVQAGLMRNPTLLGKLGLPVPSSAGSAGYSVGLEFDFLDLLLLPARKKVAAADFEAAKRRVGDEIAKLAHDVRVAFYALLAAQQVATMRHAVLDAADVSVELARRQHEAGNISELDLANEEGLSEQVRLDAARSDAEAGTARERLTRLLGLWGPDAGFKTAPGLAELPEGDPPLEHLESLAIVQRLDVDALRQDAQARAHELAMAKNFRFLTGATVGAGLDHDAEGRTLVGPTASLELPIFDAKQARIAKLEARVRGADRRLAASSIDVRSEVRETWARLVFSRTVVQRFRTTVIPLRERIVALAQRHYDAMLLGVYQLLLAKQAEVNAYREYIEAVRDYWIARSDLERAIGGRVPSAGSTAPPNHTPPRAAP